MVETSSEVSSMGPKHSVRSSSDIRASKGSFLQKVVTKLEEAARNFCKVGHYGSEDNRKRGCDLALVS